MSRQTLNTLINKELAKIAWKDNLEVTKVAINGNGPLIQLDLEIKSLYDGAVCAFFVPIFVKKEQRLELKDLKVELADKGILAKGLNWLIKGFAKEKLINTIQTQLDEQIGLITKRFINQALSVPVFELMNLNLNCHEMDILNIRFEQDSLHLDLELQGQLSLDSTDR